MLESERFILVFSFVGFIGFVLFVFVCKVSVDFRGSLFVYFRLVIYSVSERVVADGVFGGEGSIV